MLIPTPIATCACECTAGTASTAKNNAKYLRYRTLFSPPEVAGFTLTRLRKPSRRVEVLSGSAVRQFLLLLKLSLLCAIADCVPQYLNKYESLINTWRPSLM